MHNIVTLFNKTYWRSVIQLLNYHMLFLFLLQLCLNISGYLSCSGIQVPYGFLFLMSFSLWMLNPVIGPFIFRIHELQVVDLMFVNWPSICLV